MTKGYLDIPHFDCIRWNRGQMKPVLQQVKNNLVGIFFTYPSLELDPEQNRTST